MCNYCRRAPSVLMRGKLATTTMESQYPEWSAQLQRFVLARLGDSSLAEEIAQEAMFRLICKLSQGVEIKFPKAWLFQTARNLAVDVVRSNLPKPLGLEALAALPDPASLIRDPEVIHTRVGEASRRDLLDQIPEVLEKLPAEDRATLIARYRYGVSCQKMASMAGISLGNAKVRLYRARRRVKKVLETKIQADS